MITKSVRQRCLAVLEGLRCERAVKIASLNAGDSWSVPKNTNHTYKIIETFSAIEATSPPAFAHP